VEDEEEFEEEDAFDDLTYGIDNVLEFDFENDFYFTKYDHVFYYLTLYLLILNGHFFLSGCYLLFGEAMHMVEDQDEDEIREAERTLMIQDYAVLCHQAGEMDPVDDDFDERPSDDENERIILAGEIMYFVGEIGHSKYSGMMSKEVLMDYRIFAKKYFNLVKLFNTVSKKKSSLDVRILRNFSYNVFYSEENESLFIFKMTPYIFDEFKNELISYSSMNEMGPTEDIKICYLIM